MIRVSEATRDAINEVSKRDFDGATVDETLQSLLREHFWAETIAAVERFAREHPEEWAEDIAESERMDRSAGLSPSEWDET